MENGGSLNDENKDTEVLNKDGMEKTPEEKTEFVMDI